MFLLPTDTAQDLQKQWFSQVELEEEQPLGQDFSPKRSFACSFTAFAQDLPKWAHSMSLLDNRVVQAATYPPDRSRFQIQKFNQALVKSPARRARSKSICALPNLRTNTDS